MGARRSRLFAAAAMMLACLGGAVAQATPANDDFANRTVLTGSSISFTGTLAAATLEGAEMDQSFPGSLTSGGSVWWTWTAPASTTVIIEMARGSANGITNASLYVYAGNDLNLLTLIDTNYFSDPPGRYVSFSANSGATYQFRVASPPSGDLGGSFTLNLTATNPPLFLVQPKDCTVSPSGSAFFCVMAAGLRTSDPNKATTRYQWSFNGVPIPRETSPSLVVSNVTAAQLGNYSVIASNAGGITQGGTAILTLTEIDPVPQLAAMPPTNSATMRFSLTGEAGRWYKIESSQNLKNWVSPGWVKNTNGTAFLLVPRLGANHFVRASINTTTDACVAQLKAMLWAQYMVAIEWRRDPTYFVFLEHMKPYLPLGVMNNIPGCPEFGFYDHGPSIVGNPTCSLQSHGHVLP